MMLSKELLIDLAQQNGYRLEILEKVIRLAELLNKLMTLPYLKDRIVLKGGTALNLFCFERLSRLSVELDFNYIVQHCMLPGPQKSHLGPACVLAISEIIAILVMFKMIKFSNFKIFYKGFLEA